MPQTLSYISHSCTRDRFPVEAIVGGRTMEATIEGLVVEAVSEDGSMGHTFRLQPDDIAAAEAEFAVGSAVTVTVSGSGVAAQVTEE